MNALLSDLEVDALTEVATIGSGRAATALAQLIGRRIMIGVPLVAVTVPQALLEQAPSPDDEVVAVTMPVLGDISGRTLFMAAPEDARYLCDLMMRLPPGTTAELGAFERSGLEEMGSILGSAYVDALSEFLGVMIMPSVPHLAVDRPTRTLASALGGHGWEPDGVLAVRTDFSVAAGDRELHGSLLFLPNVASLRAILDAVKLG